MRGVITVLPAYENSLQLPFGLRWLTNTAVGRLAQVGAVQQWYYRQILEIGWHGEPDGSVSPLLQLMWMEAYEEQCARKLIGPEVEGWIGVGRVYSTMDYLLFGIGSLLQHTPGRLFLAFPFLYFLGVCAAILIQAAAAYHAH